MSHSFRSVCLKDCFTVMNFFQKMSWRVYCKQVRQDRLTYWFAAVRRLCCSNSLCAAHGRSRIQCNHTTEIYAWVGVIFWENFSRRDIFLVSWKIWFKTCLQPLTQCVTCVDAVSCWMPPRNQIKSAESSSNRQILYFICVLCLN